MPDSHCSQFLVSFVLDLEHAITVIVGGIELSGKEHAVNGQ